MPNSLEAQIRQAMKTGSTLTIEFDQALNQKSPGTLNVFLHPANGGVRIDLDSGNQGEPAKILWLPWKQGELQTLQPGSISTVDMLFFTYYLSGCKVFAGDGGRSGTSTRRSKPISSGAACRATNGWRTGKSAPIVRWRTCIARAKATACGICPRISKALRRARMDATIWGRPWWAGSSPVGSK
ncbi:hypothetical protein BMMON2_29940 [Burkholderia mallei]